MSDRKPIGLPFRLKELRTIAWFPMKRQVRKQKVEIREKSVTILRKNHQTGSLRASFQNKITLNISMLSLIQTTWNQLSTDFRRFPFLSRKEFRFTSLSLVGFCMLSFYKRTFCFIPAIWKDCTITRIHWGFLLSPSSPGAPLINCAFLCFNI